MIRRTGRLLRSFVHICLFFDHFRSDQCTQYTQVLDPCFTPGQEEKSIYYEVRGMENSRFSSRIPLRRSTTVVLMWLCTRSQSLWPCIGVENSGLNLLYSSREACTSHPAFQSLFTHNKPGSSPHLSVRLLLPGEQYMARHSYCAFWLLLSRESERRLSPTLSIIFPLNCSVTALLRFSCCT